MRKCIFVLFLVTVGLIPLFSEEIRVVSIENPNFQIQQRERVTIPITFTVPNNLYVSDTDNLQIKTALPDCRFKISKTIKPNLKEGEKRTGTIVVEATLRPDPNIEPGTYPIELSGTYQLCDAQGVCYFPKTETVKIEVTVLPAKSASPSQFLVFILMAFFGGILLNIMPCVLPVLSIKALSLVHQAKDRPDEILKNSWLYALGIIVSLQALAAAAMGLKLAGKAAGWGFQFQNQYFVFITLITIYIFSLSLLNVFTLFAPEMNIKNQKSARMSSFLTGVMAVVLATPCTAPMLGPAVAFAFANPIWFIPPFFLSISLGLALPFILLGFFPSVYKWFPKPGTWMDYFKEAMGFILLLTAAWLSSVFLSQIGYNQTGALFIVLVATAALFRIYSVVSLRFYRIRVFLLILSIVLSLSTAFLLIDFSPRIQKIDQVENKIEYSRVFNEDEVMKSIQNGEKVFILFSAKWCMTCQTNEKLVFSKKETEDFFSKNQIVVYYADTTVQNDLFDNWIKSYGGAGVPLYLYFSPKSPQGIKLPELLTNKILFETISNN